MSSNKMQMRLFFKKSLSISVVITAPILSFKHVTPVSMFALFHSKLTDRLPRFVNKLMFFAIFCLSMLSGVMGSPLLEQQSHNILNQFREPPMYTNVLKVLSVCNPFYLMGSCNPFSPLFNPRQTTSFSTNAQCRLNI